MGPTYTDFTYLTLWVLEGGEKEAEKSFEEIIAEKSPNLMKTTNLRHYNQIVLQRILKSTR